MCNAQSLSCLNEKSASLAIQNAPGYVSDKTVRMSDLSLHWTHMSDGTLPDVKAQIYNIPTSAYHRCLGDNTDIN